MGTAAMPKITLVPIDKLIPDSANARKHSERNIEEIMRSLREFGAHSPLVVQKSTNRILVGNGRFEAMKRLGWQDVQVIFVDDDNITAARRALADNRTAELAEWDFDSLESLLSEIETDVPGWSDDEIAELLTLHEPLDLDEEETDGDGGGTEENVYHCPKCGFQFNV
jgi:ParB-like chromosome segregation protein Spo0J